MDIQRLKPRIKEYLSKFKYAIVILLVGVALLLFPQQPKTDTSTEAIQQSNVKTFETKDLIGILESIQGVGKVNVLLSVASGEKTVYQIDTDINSGDNSTNTKKETVIVTDEQRAQKGLVSQIQPATYQGAIVVCEGADSASVRLAVIQAVAKITGLGTDDICVLKMES